MGSFPETYIDPTILYLSVLVHLRASVVLSQEYPTTPPLFSITITCGQTVIRDSLTKVWTLLPCYLVWEYTREWPRSHESYLETGARRRAANTRRVSELLHPIKNSASDHEYSRSNGANKFIMLLSNVCDKHRGLSHQLALVRPIAHFQKEWKTGERVGARSVMGS